MAQEIKYSWPHKRLLSRGTATTICGLSLQGNPFQLNERNHFVLKLPGDKLLMALGICEVPGVKKG